MISTSVSYRLQSESIFRENQGHLFIHRYLLTWTSPGSAHFMKQALRYIMPLVAQTSLKLLSGHRHTESETFGSPKGSAVERCS